MANPYENRGILSDEQLAELSPKERTEYGNRILAAYSAAAAHGLANTGSGDEDYNTTEQREEFVNRVLQGIPSEEA